jgi:hypothetical protein
MIYVKSCSKLKAEQGIEPISEFIVLYVPQSDYSSVVRVCLSHLRTYFQKQILKPSFHPIYPSPLLALVSQSFNMIRGKTK